MWRLGNVWKSNTTTNHFSYLWQKKNLKGKKSRNFSNFQQKGTPPPPTKMWPSSQRAAISHRLILHSRRLAEHPSSHVLPMLGCTGHHCLPKKFLTQLIYFDLWKVKPLWNLDVSSTEESPASWVFITSLCAHCSVTAQLPTYLVTSREDFTQVMAKDSFWLHGGPPVPSYSIFFYVWSASRYFIINIHQKGGLG